MGDAFPMQNPKSRTVYTAVYGVLQCCVTVDKYCVSDMWHMGDALLQLYAGPISFRRTECRLDRPEDASWSMLKLTCHAS